ncbi:MAG TPA: hypothetical protein VLN45_07575 [Ignavibacteriaceae bacterium]|nr:hypothetical protein [Ignavibacteriaceae bacterium]
MRKNIHIIIISLFFSFLLWGSISLSKDFYINVDIPVKVINFPEGYSSGTKLPEKISAKIRGNGWKLIAVNLGAESEYIISAGKDSGKKYINLYNSLSENQWLATDMEVLDLNPDTISIYIEKLKVKKVKIEPDVNLNFKAGYGLATDIKVTPDSTTVSGPASFVENLNSVLTERINISELDTRKVEQAFLKNIPGMNFKVTSVTVNLDVQKIVDKNFDNLPVSVIDIPGDREVVLLPNRVSVGIRGGINILGKLNEDDFKAYVYYKDVVLDTLGNVTPQVEIPDNTSLIFTKPERLRYIIKKYN